MASSGITVNTIAPLLMDIINNPEDSFSQLVQVTEYLESAPNFVIQHSQKYIIGALSAFVSKTKNSANYKAKSALTVLLGVLFKKSRVDELKVFLFAYKYLLDEVYDHRQQNCVAVIEEEYKLQIMQTMISLSQSLTWDVLEQVYNKERALVLCQMIYVALEMAKSEQYRTLRISCIECVMSLSRVDDSSDFADLELRCRIADVFILFLPGITTSLGKIAVEDEKQGHAIAMTAVKAWGRIVTLQMQTYNPVNESAQLDVGVASQAEVFHTPSTKWKTPEEVKQYLDNSKRTTSWYRETDGKLYSIMSNFSKLTHHSHMKVRKQLLETCLLLIKHCSATIPKTLGCSVNHLIALSEDEDNKISESSRDALSNISYSLSENDFTFLFQNLEENFYIAVMALPRIFNTLDDMEQLTAINLIIGYLKVFGQTKLVQVLHLPSQINQLIQSLIHISKIDVKDVELHDDSLFEDLQESDDRSSPWKNFRYFFKDSIKFTIEQACKLLSTCDVLDITSDLLMEIFINSPDDRKEATFLLNNVLHGLAGLVNSDSLCIIESVFDLYMDTSYWNIPLDVTVTNSRPEVQNNIIQICLQLEGLGKIALVMEQKFEQKLLKTLYPVFEYAGSNHSLIRAAATLTITNISRACGFLSIGNLINKNVDYLTYHILRKLHKRDETGSALKALGTVLKYSDISTLDFFIWDLLYSCDKFFEDYNFDSYLHIFHKVIKSIRKSVNIEISIDPIKSKKQKELEHEPFRITNQTQEDSEINEDQHEINDQEEIIEGDNETVPPIHIKLTEKLLQRCVHFLPVKIRSVKILVIEIFKDGLEILREWDNNMLPLVHQVWSPLIDRFHEKDDFVVINYSFQLLIVLARLSKDFIRSRTAKDVLPNIRQVLSNLWKSSHLQDKGSAYRYTQAYKLQLVILQHLGRVMIDLDLSDKDIIDTMKVVFPYLSKYQPIPIQESTLTFFADLIQFDNQLVKSALEEEFENTTANNKINYEKNINSLLNLCTL